jgi:hypothetical protein
VVAVAALAPVACAARGLAAFPGAEGFGSETLGGRGGRVIAVTSLADAGPGSLRAALAANGPRTVVFRTGGTIVLHSTLEIRNPNVTVAGQTAPGGGIQLRNDSQGSATTDSFPALRIAARDVVIRYLRIRPGGLDHDPSCARVPRRGKEQRCAPSGDIRAIVLDDAAENVVIDHVSAGWTPDEIVSVVWTKNVSIQWSIFAEALSYALYERGDPEKGKGMSFGTKAHARRGRYANRVSLHHNLFASNDTRNPSAASACANPSDPSQCLTDVRNNVVYNWGSMGTLAVNIDGHNFVNVVGNVYKMGPDTVHANPIRILDWTASTGVPGAGSAIRPFIDENRLLYRDGRPAPLAVACSRMGRTPEGRNRVAGLCRPEDLAASSAWAAPGVTGSLEAVYESVVSGAGASSRLDDEGRMRPARDATDLRIVSEVRNGGGRILRGPETFPGWPQLDSGRAPPDADGDGMPDAWETRFGFDSGRAGSPGADADGDGYTDLEEYLNGTDPGRPE